MNKAIRKTTLRPMKDYYGGHLIPKFDDGLKSMTIWQFFLISCQRVAPCFCPPQVLKRSDSVKINIPGELRTLLIILSTKTFTFCLFQPKLFFEAILKLSSQEPYKRASGQTDELTDRLTFAFLGLILEPKRSRKSYIKLLSPYLVFFPSNLA